MPWHIVPDSASCPKSRPFAVIKDSDGSTAGCHATKAAAMKQMAALYANEGMMSSTLSAPPVDNLIRAMFGPESAELRAKTDDGDGGTLFGHFAVFNRWTEIASSWEGNFLERIAPGAFTDTIVNRGSQVKVLYDHGQDPELGNKPLGAIRTLQEDSKGAYYEVDLLRDASGALVPYNRDFIAPAAKAGLLGASFRFRVTEEEWDNEPKSSKANPKGLPERTITGVDLYEFGPVTFPAYEAASASVRCGTDRFLDSLINDPRFVARFTERLGGDVVERIIAGLPPKPDPDSATRAADGPDGDDVEQPQGGTADGQDLTGVQARREILAARGLI